MLVTKSTVQQSLKGLPRSCIDFWLVTKTESFIRVYSPAFVQMTIWLHLAWQVERALSSKENNLCSVLPFSDYANVIISYCRFVDWRRKFPENISWWSASRHEQFKAKPNRRNDTVCYRGFALIEPADGLCQNIWSQNWEGSRVFSALWVLHKGAEWITGLLWLGRHLLTSYSTTCDGTFFFFFGRRKINSVRVGGDCSAATLWCTPPKEKKSSKDTWKKFSQKTCKQSWHRYFTLK